MTRLLLAALAAEAVIVALALWRSARRWRQWEDDEWSDLSDTWTTDAETWASGLRDPHLDSVREGR